MNETPKQVASRRIAQRKPAAFASRILYYRVKKNLSQVELGMLAGLSQNMIYLYETGKEIDPRLSTLERIAAALGIHPAVLCFGAMPSMPPEEDKDDHEKDTDTSGEERRGDLSA